MKIGIVTYHRTLNYGAVMQSLATRFVLEKMGHEVYYVDYWPEYHKESYKIFSFSKFRRQGILSQIKTLRSLIRDYSSKIKRKDNFEKFFRIHIYPYCRPVDEFFDVLVYGSDQIWRKQKALNGYNPIYFGKNEFNAKLHVSYAASMGMLPNNKTDKEIVKELVSHMDKISVREDDLRHFLFSLGFNNVSLSLDPTLLLSSEEWDKYLPTEPYYGDKYALLYIMGASGFDIKEVRRFAKNNGLELIVIRGYATTKETKTNITSAGPLEFIRLIKNADYVFSSSFHGLAFSIIYEKQFFASFVRNIRRAESLLNIIGESNRLLSPRCDRIPQDLSPVDYVSVKKKLQLARQNSLDFLINM